MGALLLASTSSLSFQVKESSPRKLLLSKYIFNHSLRKALTYRTTSPCSGHLQGNSTQQSLQGGLGSAVKSDYCVPHFTLHQIDSYFILVWAIPVKPFSR